MPAAQQKRLDDGPRLVGTEAPPHVGDSSSPSSSPGQRPAGVATQRQHRDVGESRAVQTAPCGESRGKFLSSHRSFFSCVGREGPLSLTKRRQLTKLLPHIIDREQDQLPEPEQVSVYKPRQGAREGVSITYADIYRATDPSQGVVLLVSWTAEG